MRAPVLSPQRLRLKLFAFPLFVLVPLTFIMFILWDYLIVSPENIFGWERLIYIFRLSRKVPFLGISVSPLLNIFTMSFLAFSLYFWHTAPIFHYLKTGEGVEKAEKSIFTGFSSFFWLCFISYSSLHALIYKDLNAYTGASAPFYPLVSLLFNAVLVSVFVILSMIVTRIICLPVIQKIKRTEISYRETLAFDRALPFLPPAAFILGLGAIYYRASTFMFSYGRIQEAAVIVRQFIVIFLLLLFFLALILCFTGLLTHSENAERRPVRLELDSLAEGRADLTQKLIVSAPNGRGLFVSDFNRFLSKFCRQTIHLKNFSASIGQGVNHLHQSFSKVSEASASQQGEIAPIISSVTEISQGMSTLIGSVKDKYDYISLNLRHIDEIASGIEGIIVFFQGIKKQSFSSLATANVVMRQIQESIEKSAQMTESMALISKKIQEAGQEAEHIDEILALIQDISEQTNILSINAAIEAAHAGDDGKGFAIVANEVRTLATESSKAVEHISKKLLDIQVIIRSSVEMTLIAEKITKENGVLVDESHKIINNMIDQFQKTGRVTENTAAIISQQGDITRNFHKQVRSLMIFFENLRNTMANQENSFEELYGNLEGLKESFASVSEYSSKVDQSIKNAHSTQKRLSHLVDVFKTE